MLRLTEAAVLHISLFFNFTLKLLLLLCSTRNRKTYLRACMSAGVNKILVTAGLGSSEKVANFRSCRRQMHGDKQSRY
jgi:hypothetical protein